MAGLAFDDTAEVDPQTSLLPSYREWVQLLAARRGENTVRGYVSDCAVFAAALCDLLGKPLPAPADEVPPLPPSLVRAGKPAVPAPVYHKAAVAVGQLVLLDLHPRNCARVLDALGATRSDASQRRLASAWSSLCRFLVRRGLLAANPMDHDAVERPHRPAPAPAPLDYSDAQRLLVTIRTADPAARIPWPARDFALAAVLLTSGLRVSEACGLRVSDLRAADVNPRLRVLGKGKKERTIPAHPQALAALHGYLAERSDRFGEPAGSDPLFVRSTGTAFSDRAMRRLVDRWYARSGVRRVPGTCVHALRHTFATTALDSGASVVEVQTLLGHASLDTTRNYLAVVGSGLEQAVAAHPAGAMILSAQAGTA